MVADDICVLGADSRVIPVAGWLKLWRASLDHLGESPDERNRVYSAEDKYRLYLENDAAQRPKLANLVFLSRGDTARIEPFGGFRDDCIDDGADLPGLHPAP